jgi:hypothetical protein
VPFAGVTHAEVYPDNIGQEVADIYSFHGNHQAVFKAGIDRNGRVIETQLSTLVEEIPPP